MLDNSIYLPILSVILASVMGTIALINWAMRARGGFIRGWAAPVFIALCWVSGIAVLFLRLTS